MNSTNQLDEIRRQNRTKILAILRNNGTMSRTAIANLTGLSAATVSTITADMLANGILCDDEEPSDPISTRGRPRVNLSFNASYASVGVFVIQLNQIYLALVDYCGEIIYSSEISLVTSSISSEELLKNLVDALNVGLKQTPSVGQNLKHIGVGVQGTSDVLETMLLWSPAIQPRNVPIARVLNEQFGVSASIHNDCNIAAKSLRHKEPEVFQSDFATILLSQGIGIGLYLNGQLLKGQKSSGAEFGHMTYIPGGALCRCGRRGCIEAYAGSYGIFRSAENYNRDTPSDDNFDPVELAGILDQARGGDEAAIYAFKEAGRAIGTGLANLFAMHDPFPVAIVGMGATASDQLEGPIRQSISGSNMFGNTQEIPLHFYDNDIPFVREGCAITALMRVDEIISGAKTTRAQKTVNGVSY